MARLILNDSYPSEVSSLYSWWKITIVGFSTGVLYWILTILINQFVVEPMFCGANLNAQICSGSIEMAGNLANIVVALVGLFVLVRLGVLRPLIVAVSSAVVLWGLAGWTSGLFWLEVAGWSVLLFVLNYVLFSWLARYTKSIAVIIMTLVVVVTIRIVTML